MNVEGSFTIDAQLLDAQLRLLQQTIAVMRQLHTPLKAFEGTFERQLPILQRSDRLLQLLEGFFKCHIFHSACHPASFLACTTLEIREAPRTCLQERRSLNDLHRQHAIRQAHQQTIARLHLPQAGHQRLIILPAHNGIATFDRPQRAENS